MTIEPQAITKGLVTESDFQQAKNPTKGSQFLQIVAKPKRSARKRPEPKLTRVAFRVSRLMEFCTRRELQNQTGHGVTQWPLVVLKELVDNALDACEEAEVAPVISIAVEPGSIVVEDNGGGIKTSTIKSILDYTIRVSSREAYVSPTRGAQGNALKTILAMGYVLDRERQGGNAEAVGVTIIETRGIEHRIEFRVDHVNNEPRIAHTTSPSPVKIGSRITINWPVIYYGGATLLGYARGEFIRLAEGYVWFNPHLTLRGSWYGKEFINVAATNPDWKKWGPRNPTSSSLVRRDPAAALSCRTRSSRSRPAAQSHGARVHRRVPRTFRDCRPAQSARGNGLQPSVLGCIFRRRAGQPRRHRQAAGLDAQAHQAGCRKASRHHR